MNKSNWLPCKASRIIEVISSHILSRVWRAGFWVSS